MIIKLEFEYDPLGRGNLHYVLAKLDEAAADALIYLYVYKEKKDVSVGNAKFSGGGYRVTKIKGVLRTCSVNN